MARLYNLARMSTATTGTGTITLGSAVTGFLDFVTAGIRDGETVTYAIQDGSNSEIGRGVYTASGTTLSRTVLKSTNAGSQISLSGTAQVFITPSAEDFRDVLTAPRSYYVRHDGSDTNTGLANTSAGAFLTLQKAVDVAYSLDSAGYGVTINPNAGPFNAGVTINGPLPGGGTLTIAGSTTVISTTNNSCIIATNGATPTVSGVDLRTTTGGNCLWARSASKITVGANVIFGACAGVHVQSDTACSVEFGAAYTINGGASIHMSSGQGRIQAIGLTITLTGTPAFSTLFAYAEYGGALIVFSNTYSGSATGTRYFVAKNGVIDTNGGGATYLPGDALGSDATGGRYI